MKTGLCVEYIIFTRHSEKTFSLQFLVSGQFNMFLLWGFNFLDHVDNYIRRRCDDICWQFPFVICYLSLCFIPMVRISTERLADFILLVFLRYCKNKKTQTTCLGVHLAEVIPDRGLESEEENSKILVFVTDRICRGETDLNNNIIISMLGIIPSWPLSGSVVISLVVPVSL